MEHQEQFWEQVYKTDYCWFWIGYCDPNGYGRFRFAGKQPVAHKYLYQSINGPVPKGIDLHHSCEVRNCVNPAHIEPLAKVEHIRRHCAARSLKGMAVYPRPAALCETNEINSTSFAPGVSVLAGQAIRGQEKAGEPNSLSPFNEFSGGAA